MRKSLECGDLKEGFARVRCPHCHHEYLLAFNYWGRWACSSSETVTVDKFNRSGLTLTKIIEQERKRESVGRNELENGSRRSMVSRTRAEIARRGMEELGLSAAEIARHLGVATSSITRAVAKTRRQATAQRKYQPKMFYER